MKISSQKKIANKKFYVQLKKRTKKNDGTLFQQYTYKNLTYFPNLKE